MIEHAVLSALEMMASLPTMYELPFIVPPSKEIAYRLLCSVNAMPLSRFCAVLLRFSDAFMGSAVESSVPLGFPSGFGVDETAQFNGLINDICGALWNRRIFERYSTTASIPTELGPGRLQHIGLHPTAAPWSELLSITHGVAFVRLAWDFLRERSAAGAVPMSHPDQIARDPDVRREYLDYLQLHGLTGLRSFMLRFIRNLQNPPQPM